MNTIRRITLSNLTRPIRQGVRYAGVSAFVLFMTISSPGCGGEPSCPGGTTTQNTARPILDLIQGQAMVRPTSGTITNLVLLSGSNLPAGATVKVDPPGGLTVSEVNVLSSTEMTAKFTTSPATATGPYQISVAGNGEESNQRVFKVLQDDELALISVEPAQVAVNTTTPVLLRGRNIDSVLRIECSAPHVTFSQVRRISATQVTAIMNVPTSSGTGLRTLRLVKGAGESSNAILCTFTPDPTLPVIDSITPNSGYRGSTVNVIIRGTALTGCTIRDLSPNIIIQNEIVRSDTEIEADFAIASNATLQPINVWLYKGNRQSNALPFTARQSTGTPDFDITATPGAVTVANGISSTPVTFNVTSLNGYAGPVKVTWAADGDVSPQPNTNDFTLSLTANGTQTFTRTFYRFTTGNEEIPCVWNVTDIPFTGKQKSTTVTVRHP